MRERGKESARKFLLNLRRLDPLRPCPDDRPDGGGDASVGGHPECSSTGRTDEPQRRKGAGSGCCVRCKPGREPGHLVWPAHPRSGDLGAALVLVRPQKANNVP